MGLCLYIFIFGVFNDKKLKKQDFKLFSTKNDYFDQRLECAAPKRWSKYTTLKIITWRWFKSQVKDHLFSKRNIAINWSPFLDNFSARKHILFVTGPKDWPNCVQRTVEGLNERDRHLNLFTTWPSRSKKYSCPSGWLFQLFSVAAATVFGQILAAWLHDLH